MGRASSFPTISAKTLNRSSITSKQYKELLSMEQNGPRKDGRLSFSFEYDVKITDNGYTVILTGKHLSKNRVNSMSLRDRIRYKKAIKEAMMAFALNNRQCLESIQPIEKGEVEYIFHNPVSRDHDNNSETIKAFQDTFTVLGLIVDDKRKNLGALPPKEVVSKNYKVVAHIRKTELKEKKEEGRA